MVRPAAAELPRLYFPHSMPNKLGLSPEQIERCRGLARQVADGVREETGQYTTVATERTVLRLLGVDGVDGDDVPIPNRVVESLARDRQAGAGGGALDGQRAGAGGGERFRRGRPARRPEESRGAARAPALARDGGAPRRDDARADPGQPGRARAPAGLASRGRAPAALCDRRHREHPRGRRPGRGGRARRRPVHRGHPLDGAVAARPRALRRDDRGFRRHVRHPGELPPDARGARRRGARDRPVRAPGELLLGPLHARDRGDGRARAPRHDAERRALRHHLPRHQSPAHAHRPELLAPHQRGRRRRHQHGRGQLPDDGRRGRAGARRARLAVHQRAPGEERGPRGLADRARPRLRDRPRARGRPAPRDRAGRGRAGDLSRRAAQVHAADQAHDGQHLPGLPAERAVHADLGRDGPVDPPARDADRGAPHAVPPRPVARDRAGEDHPPQRAAPRPRRSPSRRAGASSRGRTRCCADAEKILETVGRKGLFEALAAGVFADTRRPRDRGRGFDGVVRRHPAYANPFMEAWSETPAGARA